MSENERVHNYIDNINKYMINPLQEIPTLEGVITPSSIQAPLPPIPIVPYTTPKTIPPPIIPKKTLTGSSAGDMVLIIGGIVLISYLLLRE